MEMDRAARMRTIGVWLLGSAALNAFIAFQMLGERGRRNRERIRELLEKTSASTKR
eukprot:m.14920 g.14920  ORF g.14920 m.14920 type:complete len:56 (-) comp7263_c0_seq1:549-716(-)